MSAPDPLIRNVSDTALWTALYRARESERRDAWLARAAQKRHWRFCPCGISQPFAPILPAGKAARPPRAVPRAYVRRLAGERGARIAAAVSFAKKHAWSFTART
ncbi:MAG TPA: hypothetical protein VNF74_05035 [Terriglobales bacterium]|nr:hypothetical protein [Terriglobales bacterium]